MNKINKNILRKICWKKRNIVKCAAGFITHEDKDFLTISSTIGHDGYIDKIDVEKSLIISNESFFT